MVCFNFPESQRATPHEKKYDDERHFAWSAECQESFDCLKRLLATSPVLQHPDFSKPFIGSPKQLF